MIVTIRGFPHIVDDKFFKEQLEETIEFAKQSIPKFNGQKCEELSLCELCSTIKPIRQGDEGEIDLMDLADAIYRGKKPEYVLLCAAKYSGKEYINSYAQLMRNEESRAKSINREFRMLFQASKKEKIAVGIDFIPELSEIEVFTIRECRVIVKDGNYMLPMMNRDGKANPKELINKVEKKLRELGK